MQYIVNIPVGLKIPQLLQYNKAPSTRVNMKASQCAK